MRLQQLVLPPGSLVTINSHGAHAVSPLAEDSVAAPQLAASWFAKKADSRTGHVMPPTELPPLLALQTARQELPPRVARFFSNAVDRELIRGRVSAHQA